MKRALVLSTLYPNAHAPRFGTFVARSMEAVAACGDWDVTLFNPIGIPPIVFGRYRPLAEAAVDGVEGGVDIHRPTFTLIPRVGVASNARRIAQAVLPLARAMHRDRPFDVVDAQFFFPEGPAAAQIADALGLPFTILGRGSDITYWGTRDFAREQMLYAAARADGLMAVSEALRRDMAGLGMDGGKIGIRYTGLDRDRFRPLGHTGLRTTLAQSLGVDLPRGAPLFATVGSLDANKGQALVVEALETIREARLLLVGKGPDEDSLRRLAKERGVAERVHVLGTVDHDLLPVILSAADAMVLPSAREGLANAWIEALACGTPLVICDAGGAREIVTTRDAGLIVERRVDAIADGMRAILADPVPAERVAATVERFSWEATAGTVASHWERLTTRRGVSS
ncbi:glycosyltransferase [Qipengyuania sp. JC766]|uniref:glycosyltransferase n=1 Tax=Qipengyuania sp. JC766 TaxID=3232139 RepID=UPI0034575F9F